MRLLPPAMPAALVLGMVMGTLGLPVGPAAVGAVVLAVAAAAGWRMRRPAVVLPLVACALACAGVAWGAARVQQLQPVPVERFGQVSGRVVVTGMASRGRQTSRMPVEVRDLLGEGAVRQGARVLLDLPLNVRPPQVGQVVALSGRLVPAAHAGSPAWWVAWLRRQGVSARLRAQSWRPAGWRGGPAGARDALRRWAHANAAAGLTGDSAALVTGMALGGGDGLSEQAATRMRDAGLWHLLAVSGQNVAVIGIGVMIALGAAGVGRRRRIVVAGVAMLAYCLACDGGASVMRAGVMGAIGVAADLRGGRRAPWNALLVTLAMMLVLDPLSIGDPGLQLSFAAVAGLFAIAPALAQWGRGIMPGRMADLVAQSAGAGLATAPVLAVGFGSVSVVGLLANLIAVPVAGPVVVAAMLGVVGGSLWQPLGVLLSALAALGAWVILAVATLASAIPGAVQQVPAWAAIPLAVLAALPPLVWWWLRRPPSAVRLTPRTRWPVRRWPVAVGCGVAVAWACVPMLPGCGASHPPAGPALRMLDVGQGASVALRDGRQVGLLIDAGPPGDPAPIVGALDRMSATGVGVVMLSHGSADHAGGVRDLLASTSVGRLLLPWGDRASPLVRECEREARARGIPVDWADAGTEVTVGAWTARVIGPAADEAPGGDPNARSLVVHATAAGLAALVPGDAESPVLSRLPLPRVDVLQVAHHGSEDPGLPDVLARLDATVALVSAGRGNQFGHPRAGTLSALGAAGARVLRTDMGGDIDVSPGRGGIVVRQG